MNCQAIPVIVIALCLIRPAQLQSLQGSHAIACNGSGPVEPGSKLANFDPSISECINCTCIDGRVQCDFNNPLCKKFPPTIHNTKSGLYDSVQRQIRDLPASQPPHRPQSTTAPKTTTITTTTPAPPSSSFRPTPYPVAWRTTNPDQWKNWTDPSPEEFWAQMDKREKNFKFYDDPDEETFEEDDETTTTTSQPVRTTAAPFRYFTKRTTTTTTTTTPPPARTRSVVQQYNPKEAMVERWDLNTLASTQDQAQYSSITNLPEVIDFKLVANLSLCLIISSPIILCLFFIARAMIFAGRQLAKRKEHTDIEAPLPPYIVPVQPKVIRPPGRIWYNGDFNP